jgi:hypothetical protein
MSISNLSAIPGDGGLNFNLPHVHALNSSTPLVNATETILTNWGGIFGQLASNFNLTTGFFTAPVAGHYLVTLQFGYQGGVPSADYLVSIIQSSPFSYGQNIIPSNIGGSLASTLTTMIRLQAGETLRASVRQTVGAPLLPIDSELKIFLLSTL